MENLKKFNSKSMIKFISKECSNLSTVRLCEMQRGLAMFLKIYMKYDKTIYGSNKRIEDLIQYTNLISNLTLIRLKKEELPY